MDIPIEIFAPIEQVLEYVRTNIESFETYQIDQLESNKYYLLEPQANTSSSWIIYIHKISEFYFVITFVLEKKPNETRYIKLTDQSKKNMSKSLFVNDYSSTRYTIKKVGSVERIKHAFRNISQTNQIEDFSYSHAINVLRPNGGHMLDYVRQNVIEDNYQVNRVKPEEVKDGETYADNITCKICFTNKVNIVYVPCGHCFCSDCDSKKTNLLCAICRAQIRSTQTFFI